VIPEVLCREKVISEATKRLKGSLTAFDIVRSMTWNVGGHAAWIWELVGSSDEIIASGAGITSP
jgi:hypothetical protein